MKPFSRFFALALLAMAAALPGAEALPKAFAHPDRIRYDGSCLTIDGKDVFIFSGAFHYFRCPKPLWRDRFRAIKAAGCNAVETYVPWNWYERRPPASLDDFSQDDFTDLKEWLRMAQDEFGLYTIVRPGPYICAEWDGGGFPRWLLAKMPRDRKSGVWLRGDDPTFLAWSEHWMKAVCPVIAAEQITRKPRGHPGVILVQIENEYDLYKAVPDEQRAPQLRALYAAAVAGGIDVPLFTCWSKQCRGSDDPQLSQVFDTLTLYPRFKIDATAERFRALEAQQTDAPAMAVELQGGWFSKVGGALAEDQPGITAAETNAHTLLAIQEGATVLNYYMIFGGTNFGLWAARNMTTSYDYDAPIREAGGVGDKYLAVQAIGRMLQRHGADLARSRALECQAETGSPDVTVAARQGRGGATYLFFRNHSLEAPRRGSAVIWIEQFGNIRVDYDLGAFGFKVLYLPPAVTDPHQGEWLPKSGALPRHPEKLASAVRPAAAQMRADPGFTDWVAAPAGSALPELGVTDARPVIYSATLTLGDSERGTIDTLKLDAPAGEGLAAMLNGRVIPLGDAREVPVAGLLRTGENTLSVFYNQAGQANTGPAIQAEPGIKSAAFGRRGPNFEAVRTVTDWKLGRMLGGCAAGWPALGAGDQPGWTAESLDAQRPVARKGTAEASAASADSLATWYRVEFELPPQRTDAWVPWRALIDAAGDGLIFLNGQPLGRYWGVGPQREFYLPECWLKFGAGQKNVLTFCLSPIRKGAGLNAVEISPYADQAEMR